MRPEILFPLFEPVTNLSGIGPRNAKLVERLAGPRVADLLWLLPRDLIDRRYAPKLADAEDGRIATVTVTIGAHIAPPNRRLPYRVQCHDDTGTLTLVFFHAKGDYLKRVLPEGEIRVVSGRLEAYRDSLQMTHPDHIVQPAEKGGIEAVEPVYPSTADLSAKTLSRAIKDAVSRAPEMPEWLDLPFKQQREFTDWKTALTTAHAPSQFGDLSPEAAPRRRLAYDELLANQLALALVRYHQRATAGRSMKGDRSLRQQVYNALPYKLTGAQNDAIKDINADMAADGRMLRLLQGDVGSGKTIVALFMMLNAVECGGQAAFMAPTEILARQHYDTLVEATKSIDINIAILTGRDKGPARREILEQLAGGGINIIVGTHALFQEDVEFKRLYAAVIDEQHRFGVHQRLLLAKKGSGVDVLVMTATPIPRSLTLTVYGDLDVSRLTEKPPGRKPVDTRVIPMERHTDVLSAVARAIRENARIYWVCPLVEESAVSDLAAAEDRFRDLNAQFPDRVALVHGRMKGAEKDESIRRFASGEVNILVATTVIEVGVDVPDATIMVIEHAERFGLAQLHQLRGRIGRGERQSTCLLLYAQPLSDTAKKRLAVLRDTEDGFRIAEEDLKLRGAGEMLGTKQSGLPQFRVADIGFHGDLLAVARDDAKLILDKDPHLESPRGKALRVLLYLFERDAAIANLRSG